MDSTIDFVYTDTDTHLNEVAELYSYNEDTEFIHNRISFEELMEDNGLPLKWSHMPEWQKSRTIEQMAEKLEMAGRVYRTRAIRAFLYLVQGNFGDCLSIEQQPKNARKNIFQLYDYGLFPTFVQLVHFEINNSIKEGCLTGQCSDQPTGLSASAISGGSINSVSNDPNTCLKLLISIVYLFVEEMNFELETDPKEWKAMRATFKEEISQPICGELFHITLFEMVIKLCNGTGSKFPTKKILLLLWKVLLLTLGSSEDLIKLKNSRRQMAGLNVVPDNTLEVTRKMRPASPPPSATELIDSQLQRKRNFRRQMVVKQNSYEDSYAYDDDSNSNSNGKTASTDDDELVDDAFETEAEAKIRMEEEARTGVRWADKRRLNENASENGDANAEENAESNGNTESPRPSSPVPREAKEGSLDKVHINLLMRRRTLPWQPKIRQREIDAFFNQVRKKFIGYILPDDSTTTAGLPAPILESIEVLRKHLYVSLAEVQIKREDEMARFPLTVGELDDASLDSFAEHLYHAMLPNLPQYLISLLKLLLASVSSIKTKAETGLMRNANANANGGGAEPISGEQLHSIKLKIDLNRHQEIIIKAISGILILLLKYYKVNHIYQFEYISQQLMFANCIPLVIKFITQDIVDFVLAKNSIGVLDFPACVIGEHPELTWDSLRLLSETQTYSWRNMFSSINLLRLLNKLTKWKSCRVMMLVLFKSAQPLKRALRVQHAMFQVYALKLLKIQAKFLGRQWRKNNMKTMSAIYQKVRHRL